VAGGARRGRCDPARLEHALGELGLHSVKSSREEDDMTRQSIEISFPDVSPDVAGALAESLAQELRTSVKDDGQPVKPEIRRADQRALDFGATLVLVLGAPAVVILANAIRDWVRRTDRAELAINVNGTVIRNVTGKDAAEIVKALNARK
jgi:hypothetical protein